MIRINYNYIDLLEVSVFYGSWKKSNKKTGDSKQYCYQFILLGYFWLVSYYSLMFVKSALWFLYFADTLLVFFNLNCIKNM